MQTSEKVEDPQAAERSALPGLVIRWAGNRRTLAPADGHIVIGRQWPAHIEVDDPRISKNHVKIEPTPRGWILTDMGSRNGTFVDGRPCATATIVDGMTIRLGSAAGIPVQFAFADVGPPRRATRTGRPRASFAPGDDGQAYIGETAGPHWLGAQVATRAEATSNWLDNIKVGMESLPPHTHPATLGQRLYAARYRCEVTAGEAPTPPASAWDPGSSRRWKR